MAEQTTRHEDEEDLQQHGKESARRETPAPPDGGPPHAGRTGEAGARAERPWEGSKRKPPASPQPGRGGKAPSATSQPSRADDEDLPQAARDATL